MTIDATAPSTPSISTTTDLTNNPTPTIEGTAEVGTTVELFDVDVSLGTATTDSSGLFTIVSDELVDDSYEFTIKATDAAGNQSAESSALEIEIDTTAPAKPDISTNISVTTTNTPIILVSADSGSTVTLYNGTDIVGTGIANSDVYITTDVLTDGNY